MGESKRSRKKSRRGCCCLVLVLIGLGVFFAGYKVYGFFDELNREFEIDRQETEKKIAESEREWEEQKAERQRRDEERERQWQEEQRQRDIERKEAMERTRRQGDEMQRQFDARWKEREQRQALERAMSGIGDMPADQFEEISRRASEKIAELSIRPLEPLVLFQLVATGVKAARRYARDIIFGDGLQETIMKELVREETILGDRPEDEKKLIGEKVAESIWEWVNDQAK